MSSRHGPKPLPRKGDPTPSDLSVFRCRKPIFTKSDELLLIKLAQSGIQWAGWALLERFHRKISPIAANHVPSGSAYWKRRKGRKLPSYHTGELYDELLSTGSLAAWEAVLAFKVDSGLRFWTFAHKQVVGAISDAAKEHMKGGIAGETRADRWLFNHWNAKPEQLLEATKGFGLKKPTFKSLEEAGEAIKEFRQRYQWQKIDGAELVPAGYQGRSGRFPDDDVPRSYVTAIDTAV